MREDEIRNNFSNNLLLLRKSKGLSQTQLAEKLNYTFKAVSKWENNETIPDIVTLQAIAEYFSVTVDELISNKDVVYISNKSKNHRRITLSSVGLSVVIPLLIYLALLLSNTPKSYIAIPFTAFCSGIVYLIFSCLWFKKFHVFLATTVIIWSTLLIVILFMDFAYWWLILIIGAAINLAFFPFYRVIFAKEKSIKSN